MDCNQLKILGQQHDITKSLQARACHPNSGLNSEPWPSKQDFKNIVPTLGKMHFARDLRYCCSCGEYPRFQTPSYRVYLYNTQKRLSSYSITYYTYTTGVNMFSMTADRYHRKNLIGEPEVYQVKVYKSTWEIKVIWHSCTSLTQWGGHYSCVSHTVPLILNILYMGLWDWYHGNLLRHWTMDFFFVKLYYVLFFLHRQ